MILDLLISNMEVWMMIPTEIRYMTAVIESIHCLMYVTSHQSGSAADYLPAPLHSIWN